MRSSAISSATRSWRSRTTRRLFPPLTAAWIGAGRIEDGLRVLLYFHGLEDAKQSLAAPRLISALSGSAFECFPERDPGDFRHNCGVKSMLDILDARYQYSPEQELSEWQETTAFATRYESTKLKVEELVTQELKLERSRVQEASTSQAQAPQLGRHQATVAALPDGAEHPPAPVLPPPF